MKLSGIAEYRVNRRFRVVMIISTGRPSGKGKIMKTVLLISLVVLCAAGTALVCAGTAENPQDGDKLITVRSENDEIVTVSDLYSYSGPKGTGTRTTHLAKGDSRDDVHIAPHGTKTFYLGQCQS